MNPLSVAHSSIKNATSKPIPCWRDVSLVVQTAIPTNMTMQLASPYPFPAKGQRPLIKDKLPGLMKNARFAVETKDLALAMLCAEEASHRATRTLKSVLAVLKAMDFPPQHLLDKVIKAARAVPKATLGEHHVYVILLYNRACEQPYGLYVGETSQTPKDRFAQRQRPTSSA